MNTRDSHATRRAPDWRSVAKDDGEPGNWAEVYAFFSGAAVTLLGVFILLLIFGIRP